jgi:YVTN family beta-propeller protein
MDLRRIGMFMARIRANFELSRWAPGVVLSAIAALTLASCAMVSADSVGTTAAAPRALLAVVSKGLPGVTIYDAATDQRICEAKMDVAPHEAAFSHDGRLLYVPVYSSANLGQPGPDGHTINFLRTADCSIEHAMDTDPIKRPHFAELGRSGKLYVTAEQNQSVLVIDPRTRAITAQLPTGSRNSHFFAMTQDEQRLFTSNVGDKTVSVIDIPGKRLLATVDVGASNQRMTVSPDDRWFVTSLWQSKQIAVYRTRDWQLDFKIDIDGAPFVARFSPDGKTLYNMGMAPGAGPQPIRVWRVDLATRKVVATSSESLGTGTGGLQVNPVNGLVYLTAYSGTVSVLDPVNLKLVRQFAAPDTPDGIFFWSKN